MSSESSQTMGSSISLASSIHPREELELKKVNADLKEEVIVSYSGERQVKKESETLSGSWTAYAGKKGLEIERTYLPIKFF